MATAPHEPHQWTVGETLAELAARRISAEELLDHHLARRAALDGAINAVVATDVGGARRAARDIDARRAAGAALPPLAGVTMTIKDSFEVVGMPATCGIPELAQHRPTRDADAVARLRAAGAVIYGKTNCPLGVSDHQSYNPIYGITRNPWDAARTPGGSSGGSAAALAAGFSALELGSDIGGSIRLPSHFCGVYGHKPSWGLVSGRGHIPPPPGVVAPPAPLAVIGPLARAAADLELALPLLAGAADDEAPAWALQLPPPRHERLRDFRVALWLDAYPVDSAYAAAIERFAQALAAEGVAVQRLGQGPVDPAASHDTYLDLLFGVIGSGAPEAELAAYRAAAAGAPPDSAAARLARATAQPLRQWVLQAARQAALRRQWAAFFESCDVLLCPVAMTQAFAHQTDDGHGPVPQLARTLPVDGAARPYLDNLMWPGLVTVAHLPSTARPLNERVGGLPAGVQIVGPYLHDRTALRFAALCDQAFGRLPPPPLA
ncbi:MAG: amidase [Proteobacteria bacterium]|nr:amidase [Pseudomonadota bacterium]